MSKRKLNRRQAWRIEKIQQEKAARAAKKQQALTPSESQTLGPEQQGLVTAHYGTFVDIESNGSVCRCHFRTNLGSLVTGDQVIWQAGDPYGVVVAVLPRKSELSRPDTHKGNKVIAANIDRILIVIAPLPKPHSQLIDRYLIAAERQQIHPVLILNKTDLLDQDNQDNINALLDLYRNLGYEVITSSYKSEDGMAELTATIKGHTSIFVGQSGVGKSSLVNRLIPNLNLQVGEISVANEKGVHTTTLSRLVHFPAGGQLIDSPGIREFGLWDLEVDDILHGLIEFRDLLGHCKFRDCHHKEEPGCAIKEAYEQGKINPFRMQTFINLQQEIIESKE